MWRKNACEASCTAASPGEANCAQPNAIATPIKRRERRRLASIEERARIRKEEHEAAQKKEEIDADESRLGNRVEVHRERAEVRVGTQPRDLPEVEPHDERDRDPAQTVEWREMLAAAAHARAHAARSDGFVAQIATATTIATTPPET